MAVSRGPESDRFFVTESVAIPDVPSSFACPYFGSGRWSCPSQCPNVEASLRSLYITEENATSQCRMVTNPPDDYLVEDLRTIGIECRTPDQKPFNSLPLRIISKN